MLLTAFVLSAHILSRNSGFFNLIFTHFSEFFRRIFSHFSALASTVDFLPSKGVQ